jgi:hypothetical protein
MEQSRTAMHRTEKRLALALGVVITLVKVEQKSKRRVKKAAYG